jgi:hypothetical protein
MPLHPNTKIRHIPFSDRRLGRHVVHDPQSRGYAADTPVDTSTWHTKTIRIYDPVPNPNQPVGCCTTCAESMMLNALGNRKPLQVFTLEQALSWYRVATRLDPFEGAWEPDDTGSYGLAAWKAARSTGHAAGARWRFDGADGVVQEIMGGRVVSIGTMWSWDMFEPKPWRGTTLGMIEPTGGWAGGHQYVGRGYVEPLDAVMLRCWWDGYRDVLIKRPQLNDLIMDDGDVHVTDIAA